MNTTIGNISEIVTALLLVVVTISVLKLTLYKSCGEEGNNKSSTTCCIYDKPVQDVRVISAPPVEVSIGDVTLSGDVNVVNTVDVNVNNTVTVQGTVNAILDEPIDVNVNNTVTVQGTVNAILDEPIDVNVTNSVVPVSFPTVSQDAFGRLRMSNPYTLFDSSFRYGDSSYYWNTETTNGGFITHLTNESSIALAVTGTNGSKVIRETKHVYTYQPGKSLLVMCTFVMSAPNATITQTVGYGGENDGVFFRQNGENGQLEFIIKTSNVGTTNKFEAIPKSQWKALNGNEGEPIFDITRPQIVWFDLEWLGVGSVRCGFVIDGQFVLCCTFHHANILIDIDDQSQLTIDQSPSPPLLPTPTDNYSGVYMKTASLPVRYMIQRISSDASPPPTMWMKQICSTIISEGGYTNVGVSRTVSTLNQFSAVGDPPSEIEVYQYKFVPIISIRLKPDRIDAVAVPISFEIYLTDNAKAASWRLCLNRKLSKTDSSPLTWIDADFYKDYYPLYSPTPKKNSSVQYCYDADNQIDPMHPDNGFILKEGFIIGGSKGGSITLTQGVNEFFGQLGRTIGGVSDTITLAVYAINPTNKAHATLTFQEHTFSTEI